MAQQQGSELRLTKSKKGATRPSIGGDEFRRYAADAACGPLNCTCSESLGRTMQLTGAHSTPTDALLLTWIRSPGCLVRAVTRLRPDRPKGHR